MQLRFLSVAVILFSAVVSHAYIPPYWMIISRTSDNHGKGPYFIDQEVAFQVGDKTLIANERWTILNEHSMRVEVTGRRQLQDRLRMTYIYKDGRRYFVDENGVRKSEKITESF